MTTQNRELASLIDNSGNVTATGNLTVSGTTTTISSTVQTIADPLIELNTGASSNSNDLGFVFERGSTGDNACLIWDESADVFVVGTTTATGTSTGNMSFTAAGLTAGAGVFSSLDISGDIDVDGTTNLDVVDIDGAVDMASTLGVSGVVTANAGVVVDNITIDGTEIDLSSGDLTLDVEGDIVLDANGADVIFKDDGTEFGRVTNSSTDFVIQTAVSDKDFIIKGNDGGSTITPLTLDMSAGGDLFLTGGLIDLKNDGSAVSQIKFYCESSNAHAQTLIGAPHSEGANNVLTLPGTGGDARLVSTSSTATLTNKTITAATVATSLDMNGTEFILDADADTSITADTDDQVDFKVGGSDKLRITATALVPASDDAYDLGTSSLQFRDVYTGDLNLNNTKTRTNEVDGTSGSWTIQEGENDLYLLNRLNGKKYKFNLTEVK